MNNNKKMDLALEWWGTLNDEMKYHLSTTFLEMMPNKLNNNRILSIYEIEQLPSRSIAVIDWWNDLKQEFKEGYCLTYFGTMNYSILPYSCIKMLYNEQHPSNPINDLYPFNEISKDEEPTIEELERDLWNQPTGMPPIKEESQTIEELKEQNKLLREALRKNHQWALCLLADIEAGNVEYDEKYCLELNQDIAETTQLLK